MDETVRDCRYLTSDMGHLGTRLEAWYSADTKLRNGVTWEGAWAWVLDRLSFGGFF